MKRKRKYGNKKVTVDGIKFDSIKEARRYSVLKSMNNSGIISDLKTQVKFYFPVNGSDLKYVDSNRRMSYVADFEYFENEVRVIEDVKGFKTEKYKIKKALMAACHGIIIKET